MRQRGSEHRRSSTLLGDEIMRKKRLRLHAVYLCAIMSLAGMGLFLTPIKSYDYNIAANLSIDEFSYPAVWSSDIETAVIEALLNNVEQQTSTAQAQESQLIGAVPDRDELRSLVPVQQVQDTHYEDLIIGTHSLGLKAEPTDYPPPTPMEEALLVEVHDPIFIDGDEDFIEQAEEEEWLGTGTEFDPYIIEGYSIDVGGADINGIDIRNVLSTYFDIRSCVTTGATAPNWGVSWDGGILTGYWNFRAGIYLYNVYEAKVVENTCYGNFYGIIVDQSESVILDNNTCVNNAGSGMMLVGSSYSLIQNNNCSENLWNPIVLLDGSSHNDVLDNVCSHNEQGLFLGWGLPCDYNTVMGNNFTDNEVSGIIIGLHPIYEYSRYNYISDNICSGSYYGIELNTRSSDTIVENNICNNNGIGISLKGSYSNTVANNICNNNDYGIYLDESDFNTVANNTCSNNRIGIYLDVLGSNTVENNTFLGNTEHDIIEGSELEELAREEFVAQEFAWLLAGFGMILLISIIAFAKLRGMEIHEINTL